MRLVRLEVEDFAAVRSAEVEFCAGLNVLHGPNDLGKSTLASAIRAALLLPHNSSAHEAFVQWGTDNKPRVELVFQAGSDNSFYRVRKVFGRQGSATLESSGDGQTWTQEHKGRRVDGELRKLLRWGIPEPGGKGGPRGLPVSFLSAVLMAEQGQVEAIFETNLEGDKDESGKKLLGDALQALAQDPLFKAVLAEAQAKVDEAFTAKGGLKRGRDAPFERIKHDINQKAERKRVLEGQLQETETLEDSIRRAIDARDKAVEAYDDARKKRDSLEAGFRAQQDHAKAQERLDAARAELSRQRSLVDAVAESEASLERHRKALVAAEEQLDACSRAVDECEAGVDAAKANVDRLRSDASAQARELETAKLEKELLRVGKDLEAATERVEAAEAVGKARANLASLAERIATDEAELAETRARLDKLLADEQAATASSEELADLRRYRQWQIASSEAEQAQRAARDAESLRRQAAALREEIAKDEAELEAAGLPSGEQLEALQGLAHDLRLAEAKVSVGFSVSIVRHEPTELRVRSDDDEEQTMEPAADTRTFEAGRRVELGVGNLVDIVVAGGQADARARVEELRERWQEEASPVFANARVNSLEDLEAACQTGRELAGSVEDRRERATTYETDAERKDSVGVRAGELSDRAATLRQQLDGKDLGRLASLVQELPDEWESELESRKHEAEQAVSTCADERRECESAVEISESKLDELRARHTSEAEALAGRENDLGGVWTEAKATAEKAVSDLTNERAELTARLEALAGGGDAELGEAEAELKSAEEALAAARERLKQADEAKNAADRDKSKTDGELASRRESAANVDVESAELRVAEVMAEVEAFTLPDPAVTEDDLESARTRVDELEREREACSAEIKKLEGGLEQVGGEVVKERADAAEQAYRAARERQEELELDYGAWLLLRDTLREVENTEGAHLGERLTGPVSEKFVELTGGRYGKLELDPSLAAKGVEAGGSQRELDRLSAGVLEQLATIIRLAIAAHLGSVVVLDDHLTQTDARRIGWFRSALRESASCNQVVVLTCRPQDYIDESATNGVESRVIDLERVVERSG